MSTDDTTEYERPGPIGRLMARLRGEVPADVLESYRRAGADVYALVDDLEARRAAGALGGDAWSIDDATQAALAAAWCAFALQVLGNAFLDADYDAEPGSVGYVPPVTGEQAMAFYGQVPGWLARARQAEASPSYRLDVALPAPLPRWVEVEPCPPAHLAAMRAALGQLRLHATAGMAGFHVETADDDRRRAHDRVHEVLADAEAAADYADRLWAPDVPSDIHEAIERHAKRAVERFYELGQLMAVPRLALAPAVAPIPAAASRLPGPGEPGFDPWCLTDPASRDRWQRDRTARQAIDTLWAADPDPSATLDMQAELDAAVARGDIGPAGVGHYFCCPWSPIYEVRRPTTIAGRRLQPVEQFAFDVSAEEMADGEPFRRELLVGEFRPTKTVDYCLPGGDHDD
jgi:hypothetical protein